MTYLDVKKVARLSRLYLKPEEENEFQANLNDVMLWFKDLLQMKLNLMPTYSPSEHIKEKTYFNDEVIQKNTVEEVLANVPEKKESLILVPKVM